MLFRRFSILLVVWTFACEDGDGGTYSPQGLSPVPDLPSLEDGDRDSRDPTHSTGGGSASGGTTGSGGSTDGGGGAGTGMGGMGGMDGLGGMGGMGGMGGSGFGPH